VQNSGPQVLPTSSRSAAWCHGLPYLFAGYMLIGPGWLGFLRRRAPEALVTIESGMEEV
jgi:hypothetical protein